MKSIRYPSVSLVLLLILSPFVFAGGESEEAGTTDSSSYSMVNGYPKFEPAITLTMNMQVAPTNDWFVAGENPQENAYVRWSEETLGIKWEPKWIAPDEDTNRQKLNLAAASSDLPDLIRSSSEEIAKLARSGQLAPVESLLNQHASDLTKYVYLEEAMDATNGQLLTGMMYSGNAYGLPTLSDVRAATGNVHWIRKDILDELGLPVPTTIAEYESALAAYKAKYPNGIGLFLYNAGNANPLKGLEILTNRVGAAPFLWIEKNGRLEYGSLQPEVKQALGTLNEWYEKGWVDREFVLKQAGKLDDVMSGNVFSAYGNWWWVHITFRNLKQNVPGAYMVPVPMLDPEEDAGIFSGPPLRDGNAINKNTASPEAIIFQLNADLESRLRNDEDIREKFDLRYDPTPVNLPRNEQPGPDFFNYPQIPTDAQEFSRMRYHGYYGIKVNERTSDLFSSFNRIFDAVQAGAKERLNGIDAFRLSEFEQRGYESFLALMPQWLSDIENGYYKYTEYLGPVTPTMQKRSAYLDKLESETFTKIVMGATSVEEFDSFVRQWLESGGREITDEVNMWYEETK